MGKPTVPRPAVEVAAPVQALFTGATRRPRSIERWQTNVPNHRDAVTVLPPGSRYVVFSFGGLSQEFGGEDAVHRAASRLTATQPGDDTRHVERLHWKLAGPDALADVAQVVSDSLVGTRFAFVGAEREVYAGRSQALARGAVAEEVTIVALDTQRESDDGVSWSDPREPRHLFCAHCHHMFTALADIGDALTCPGCGLTLSVHYNFSRRRAAYLAKHLATDGLTNRGSRP